MKARTNPSPKDESPSQQIDAIIKEPGDWRGKKLSQLDSNTVRAIDFHEGDTVDEPALKQLIRDAVRLNASKARVR